MPIVTYNCCFCDRSSVDKETIEICEERHKKFLFNMRVKSANFTENDSGIPEYLEIVDFVAGNIRIYRYHDTRKFSLETTDNKTNYDHNGNSW